MTGTSPVNQPPETSEECRDVTTMPSSRIRYLVVGLLLLGLGVGMAIVAPLTAPVQKGNAVTFWDYACHVKLGNEWDCMGRDFDLPRDGWFLYHDVGIDGGLFVYKVPESEIMAVMPRVVGRLEELVREGKASGVVLDGYEEWQELGSEARDNPEALVKAMYKFQNRNLEAKYPQLAVSQRAEQVMVNERWQRAGCYWVNLGFELAYLGGLIVFAFWPWLRRKGVWAWAAHFALLPLLLLIPAYLGYVQWIDSYKEPFGGAAYSMVLGQLRDWPLAEFWASWDAEIVKLFPPVLHPISQSCYPAQPHAGFLGPTAAAIMGVYTGLAVLLIGVLARRLGGRAETR